MEGWVKILKTSNLIEAEMAKAMLLDQGIEAVVVNQIDSSFIFGQASLFCKEEEEDLAKQFLQQNPEQTHE